MSNFILFVSTLLFSVCYALTTINYEDEKFKITTDGKKDYVLKIIMPKPHTERQLTYNYLQQHNSLTEYKHLIVELADDDIVNNLVKIGNFTNIISLDLPSNNLTDNGALDIAQNHEKFSNLRTVDIANSAEITEIGYIALIKSLPELKHLIINANFNASDQPILINIDDVVLHGAREQNLLFIPETFIADSKDTQYTVAKFKFKPNRNHYDDRKGAINTLVMHYTACNFDDAMKIFTEDKDNGRVSAHWIITEPEKRHTAIKVGGIPISIVPENKRAWHAGVGVWQGDNTINATSIGIENVNKGHEGQQLDRKWFSFDSQQINQLAKLSKEIIKKHTINPTRVIGHADLAFNRKQDPGILFPWKELYIEHGIGAFLADNELNEEYIKKHFNPLEDIPKELDIPFFLKQLKKYGYDIKDTDKDINQSEHNQYATLAFKAHFSANGSPQNYNVTVSYKDMLFAWGLVAKYSQYLGNEHKVDL